MRSHSQIRSAASSVGRHAPREDRPACRGRVTGGAEIPLDAASEPGVGEREIGELQALVGEDQIPVGHEVTQRPEPPTEARKHQRLQRGVGDLDCRDLSRPHVAPVAVLQRVRQRIGQPAVCDAFKHVGWQLRRRGRIRKPLQPGEGG